MGEYRLYCLDRHGKIRSAEWLTADNDEDAVRQARGLAKGGSCELWDRSRFVARTDPAPQD